MEYIGKALFFVGLVVAAVGAGILLLEKVGLPLGNLPGDIRIEHGNFSLQIPFVSIIFLSILLTVVLNIILRLLNRG